VSQWPSISSVQLCLQTSYCSWITFLGGWWQDLHSGHRKILHSAKPLNAKKTENPLCGSTSCAVALHGAAHQIIRLGQSLWDPHSLIGGKAEGKLLGSDCGDVCRSGAEVSSTRWRSPWVNLRWSLWVGAWNILSLREDDHLSLLSSECLNIGIAALLKVWRQDSGEIMVGGYTSHDLGLVALMVTMPNELLQLFPVS